MAYEILGGTFVGNVFISTAALWSGPRADKFKEIRFMQHETSYGPDAIVRIKQSDTDSEPPKRKGGKWKNFETWFVEFSDGKSVLIRAPHQDPGIMCLVLYADSRGICEYKPLAV